ncbi:MAG: endonuclease MutS2 [Lachnospiraceae bacterium]|nr:endonuclease MutS2 [Lachnospiraceae bacterium]
MNKKVLHVLEYDKIIDLLVPYAASEGGRAKLSHLSPSSEEEKITKGLNETNDALARIYGKGSLSFSGIRDIRASVKRLEVGSSLTASELLAIASLLTVTKSVRDYGTTGDDSLLTAEIRGDGMVSDNQRQDSLTEYFSVLEPLVDLEREIHRCILSEDEIADDASARLKEIRRSIRVAGDRIHTELNQLINSSNMRTYLQENVITSRNGRYCIPVKAEYKSQVQGMVHDQSSTGSTFFIEPIAVVRLNNEIRELELAEEAEIERILAVLSEKSMEHTQALESNYRTLITLDAIFAKGAFSKAMNATRPMLNHEGYVNFKKARHPLIDPKKIVPVDVYLGKDFDTLIITGPNTGGKTVTLKTVGLLTAMAQAGLNIPVAEGSSVAIFEKIYADIGDEQSIEQSLSTFSSHMTNITGILRGATKNALVLFDELCAGTDPAEGAALAISIIESLHKKAGDGIRVLATTHYSEIKVYALSEPGVCNACCEFDVETLSPTYRLLIGIPGKSNAFAISGKLGLSKEIIEDAMTRIDSEARSFEDLLADLEKSRVTIEKEREEIATYKEEIETLRKRLASKNEQIDEKRDKILERASEEAAQILREAKEYADEAIRNFNKKGLTPSQMEDERRRLREKKDQAEAKLAKKNEKEKIKATKKQYKPSDFTIGTRVRVLSMNLEGTVGSIPNAKGDFTVHMGILSSQVNMSDVVILAEQKDVTEDRKSSASKIKMSKTMNISPEINLIGRKVDEALTELDKYLDDAYLAKLPQVRVVHGKGTGALRLAVQQHLRKTSYVESFRQGEFGEGDAGVTIVNFR